MNTKDIYHIIYDYFSDIVPKRYEHRIQQWIVSDGDVQAKKDEALKSIWDGIDVQDDQVETALEIFRSNRRQYTYHLYRKHRLRNSLRRAAVLALPLLTAATAWFYSDKVQDLYPQQQGLRQQRNARNETAYFGHQKPHKVCVGNSTDTPPPV